MAKIIREKRIDLSSFQHNWAGCYIMIATKNYVDMQTLLRDARNLSRESRKAEIRLKRANKRLEETTDTPAFDVAFADYEKIDEEMREISEKQIGIDLKFIKENFRGGKIWDSESNTIVDMVAADVESFDTEVIGAIVAEAMGFNSKNA